jgi:hypothetical protein
MAGFRNLFDRPELSCVEEGGCARSCVNLSGKCAPALAALWPPMPLARVY